MFESIVKVVLLLDGVYVALGILAAVALHWRGLKAVDPGVAGGGVFFRAVITPGLIALWPVMLVKWKRAAAAGRPNYPKPFEPVAPMRLRRIHATAFKLLLLMMPPVMAAAVLTRPPVPAAARADLFDAPVAEGSRAAFGRVDTIGAEAAIVSSADGSAQLELALEADLVAPALVLYWLAEPGMAADRGVFLGSIWGPGARRYPIPADAATGDGEYLAFSLGHGREFARFALK